MITLKNKTIELFGTTIDIKFVDRIIDEETQKELLGAANYSAGEILVAKNVRGNKISKEEMQLSLLHEIMHIVLFTGQYNDCSNDEPLVEWLARCLNKLIKDKVI